MHLQKREIKMKKAQEEIVGLVIIMLVVAVVFLILLGLWIRNNNKGELAESEEIAQFLDSVLEYTSSCSLTSGFSYLSISELISACNDNEICNDATGATQDSCDVLRNSLKNLTEAAWVFSPDSPNTGYVLSLNYLDAANNPPIDILGSSIVKVCRNPDIRRGATRPVFASPGRILFSLELC